MGNLVELPGYSRGGRDPCAQACTGMVLLQQAGERSILLDPCRDAKSGCEGGATEAGDGELDVLSVDSGTTFVPGLRRPLRDREAQPLGCTTILSGRASLPTRTAPAVLAKGVYRLPPGPERAGIDFKPGKPYSQVDGTPSQSGERSPSPAARHPYRQSMGHSNDGSRIPTTR